VLGHNVDVPCVSVLNEGQLSSSLPPADDNGDSDDASITIVCLFVYPATLALDEFDVAGDRQLDVDSVQQDLLQSELVLNLPSTTSS